MADVPLIKLDGAATDGQVPTADGLGGYAWETPAGVGGSSDGIGRLGRTAYGPATTTTYSVTSDTYVNLDATNLSVTFTAPASGTVWVRQEATILIPSGGVTYLNWNIRSGGADVAGTGARIGGSGAMQMRSVLTNRITGLTPGAAYTYAWGAREEGTGTASVYAGSPSGSEGPAVIEVFAE